MLQEAVDALFDNGRRGRAVTGPGNRPLKSLSDMLKGKQGRFRQNLLGKRVDYSGRSVIVAGPNLKLHQCGLPKLMALELFKPFIMSRLVERKAVQNIKAAKKHVESMVPEVWDVLEEVIAEHPVLLNRAPTLHRLGIQAFEPVLVEGKAIQVHPLVCHAFNADFDGDQMAVHLPLSAEAQAEARILMLSSNNILSPAHGRPLATPTQDMVLGAYYLTYCDHELPRDDVRRRSPSCSGKRAEAVPHRGRGRVRGRVPPGPPPGADRVPLARRDRPHDAGPRDLQRRDRALARGRGAQRRLRRRTRSSTGRCRSASSTSSSPSSSTSTAPHAVATVLDTIKTLAFRYATQAGITVSKNDIVIPPDKEEILVGYEAEVAKLEGEYQRGLMTEEERHERIVAVWTEATEEVAEAMKANLHKTNPIFMMANSGARGSFNQIRQLAGMRGLMANPKGEIIERPIKANFMEGLSVLEYFISTHGARKGLADTALRTADSGYLTRRLVDVSQDVIIRDLDCGTTEYVELAADARRQAELERRRPDPRASTCYKPLKDGKPGKTLLAETGTELTMPRLRELARRARGARRGLPRAGALGAQVPERARRLPHVLRHVPRDRRHLRDRRRGRHHRGAVDRRAGHAAHDAHVPHGRRRRRRHHARPAARRRDLRGAEPEGRRDARRGRRQGRDRGRRAHDQGHGRPERARRERRADPREGVQLPAPDAVPRHERPRRRGRRPAERGLDHPGRAARARRARRRPSCTSSARCRRSTSRRASTSTTSTSS